MFNSTFFKFLIVFVVIIGTSFLIMEIVSNFPTKDKFTSSGDLKTNTDKSVQTIILK